MDSSAFVNGIPVDTKRKKSGGKKRKIGPRRPSMNVEGMERGGEDKDIAKMRQQFEKSLKVDLKAKKGKDGKCTCIWCDGTAKRKCTWCKGKGYREEIVHNSWEQLALDIQKMEEEGTPMEEAKTMKVQCSACSGTKQLRCIYCRGSGIGSYGHAY